MPVECGECCTKNGISRVDDDSVLGGIRRPAIGCGDPRSSVDIEHPPVASYVPFQVHADQASCSTFAGYSLSRAFVPIGVDGGS